MYLEYLEYRIGWEKYEIIDRNIRNYDTAYYQPAVPLSRDAKPPGRAITCHFWTSSHHLTIPNRQGAAGRDGYRTETRAVIRRRYGHGDAEPPAQLRSFTMRRRIPNGVKESRRGDRLAVDLDMGSPRATCPRPPPGRRQGGERAGTCK